MSSRADLAMKVDPGQRSLMAASKYWYLKTRVVGSVGMKLLRHQVFWAGVASRDIPPGDLDEYVRHLGIGDLE